MRFVLAIARFGVVLAAFAPLGLGSLLAVASREPVFAAWGGVVGVVLAFALRLGVRRSWNAWALSGRLALLGALATLSLGRSLARHGEAVDEGLWKLLGAAYSPTWISPMAVQSTAILLGVGGALAILVSHGAQRMTDWRGGRVSR